MWMFTHMPEPLEESRMTQTTGATTPYTKPQPVVIYGAVIAALTSLVGTLTALFADNSTIVLVLGIVSAVIGALAVAKDQIVKGLVVPASDAVVYVNQDGQTVAGPASELKDGTLVAPVVTPADDTPKPSDVVITQGGPSDTPTAPEISGEF
jgi:hypothetical protein